MIEFIKKYGIGFLLSAIIMLPLSYVAATTISARNVYYDGTNTNSSLTDVQAAIEKLYIMSEAKPLISFTIDSITYQAEEGMDWNEWVNSEYNTSGFTILDKVYLMDGSTMYYVVGTYYDCDTGYPIIISNNAYTLNTQKIKPSPVPC